MGRKKRVHPAVEKAAPVRQEVGVTRHWIIALILGVTFLAFSNTLFHGFAYDDQTQILENRFIHSFSNIPTAFTTEVWFWRVLQDKDPNKETGPTTPYYRPMFTVFLMIGWWLFQDWAGGWHFLNILMHLASVFFAFRILENISKDLRIASGDRPVSRLFPVALILSVHAPPGERRAEIPARLARIIPSGRVFKRACRLSSHLYRGL
jgi:hypothetical protein